MNKILLCISVIFLSPVGYTHAQQGGQPANAVTIGNPDGKEVIVHVYRKKEDPFPFIEFSVIVDESTGEQMVEITEVEGKTTDGGFMIITGVTPAADIGVTRSDRYEISFSKVSDYKVYEKAVMDYLRRLPIPEMEPDVEITAVMEPVAGSEEEDTGVVDLGDIVLDPLLDVSEDSPDESLPNGDFAANLPEEAEPIDVLTLADTNSAVVHVHRDENDIDPFKEFVVTLYRDQTGRKKAKVVEVEGVKSGTRFIIMTGFEDKGEEGILQSFAYDVSTYNVDDSYIYEEAVIEFMKGLTPAQFDGSQPTIKPGWEAALEEKEEVVVNKPAAAAPASKGRKARRSELSQRDINKMAKQVEKAKYEAPKHKSKYGKYKSGKMSSRMAKYNKKKVQCPSMRGH